MAEDSGEKTLMKVAIFCIAMSIMSTCLVSLYVAGSSDYDYDTIVAYRSQLVDFSGGQLTNDNPWVLNGVYTPFVPSGVAPEDIPNHIERDGNNSSGWLYGEKIEDYAYLSQVADIKLDPNQKSNTLLTIGDPFNYEYRNGKSWWNGGEGSDGWVLWNADFARTLFGWTGGIDDNYGYEMTSGTAGTWSYTGYRYTFDPVLPFSSEASAKDGRLSIVWYQIETNSGLSGALEIYGSRGTDQIKLGSISSSDIISTFFMSSEGYVHVFDFNFEGTHLNLTIRFDPTIYNQYDTLQDAWDAGAWSMAISSVSAGNFFDVENSNAFNVTAGSMLDTFVQIYTFDYPHKIGNDSMSGWTEVIMWLLVGLPMTLAMLFITMRLVGGVFKIF